LRDKSKTVEPEAPWYGIDFESKRSNVIVIRILSASVHEYLLTYCTLLWKAVSGCTSSRCNFIHACADAAVISQVLFAIESKPGHSLMSFVWKQQCRPASVSKPVYSKCTRWNVWRTWNHT